MPVKDRFPPPRQIALILLALLANLPGIQMWHWVSSNWVPLPFWDEWHTPGSQFESWHRGTLTWKEMFSQHNETRNFFPRILYFTLQYFGGWDVRKEIAVVFLGVCGLCFLLLRRTPSATPIVTLIGFTLMTFLCFAPVQVENFLYGIEIETFFPGFALLACAAINLSGFSFRAKTLVNLALAFVATYTFANGMLVWALAWPLPVPDDSTPGRRRLLWLALYFIVGAIFVGAYFIGYHRPAHHPEFVSLAAKFLELAHYIILWSGNYFATHLVGPFALGIVALASFWCGRLCALDIRRQREWRTFYPWLLTGAYACASAGITGVGRLGFGMEQALSTRYATTSLFFYIALIGLYFAIYCGRVRSASIASRTAFLTNAGWVAGRVAICWGSSLEKNLGVLAQHHKLHRHLLRTLEWIEPIPDNPDLALILPSPDALRHRARYLEEQNVLRLPFVHDPLAAAVQQAPPPADATYGSVDAAVLEGGDRLHLQGWAWLPKRKRPADCVVIGAEDSSGVFKPLTVIMTGKPRPDVRAALGRPHAFRAGFDYVVGTSNLPDGEATIEGWAIDLQAQKAWPLAGAIPLPARGTHL